MCITSFTHIHNNNNNNNARRSDRANFSPVAGKYTLLARNVGGGKDEEEEENEDANGDVDIPESVLPDATQELMKLIFDQKMIDRQMVEIGYDAEKCPLGRAQY